MTTPKEALRPFAACIFNDNGDITIDTSHLRTEDYMRAKSALASLQGEEAATALTEARAEIERLRRDKSAGFAFWRSIAKRFCDARKAALDRALAAESELSTLRARVLEVVGRIIAIENKEYGGDYDEIDEAREIARQLMEDLK